MDKTDKTTNASSNSFTQPPTKPGAAKGGDPIFQDAEYQQLLVEYQNARWEECNNLLENLLKKYPNHPRLLEFKRDFEFQYSFHQSAETYEKDKKKDQVQKSTRKGLTIFGILLASVVLLWGIYTIIQKITVTQQQNYIQAQVELLGGQVEALLNSGQPEKALALLQQMQTLDPQNPRVLELSTKTNDLLKLNTLYNQALAKIQEKADEEALVLLKQIDSQVSGFRDVKQLITEIQNRIDIANALTDATTAYKENRWEDAITGFEKVLSLDSSQQNALMKEQLLNSYLHRIIQMLESDQSSNEEIDKAETYYRRAMAMIPQSKVYASEREDLQKLSSNLLELKYTQTANNMISDPNQTLNSISRAVNYLSKASNLNPQNSSLKIEVTKIGMYQVALQDYVEMNWASAIDQLNQLLAIDKNYAGGLAAQLLYEAHVGRGNQYYSVGLYLDARKEYEAAETLAWEEGQNNMKLFLVEINLGYTLGRLKDYQNAASYFKYAVESINYASRAHGNPTLIVNLANAIQNYNDGSYSASYEAFVSALEQKGDLYTEKEINAQAGTILAFVAAENLSTVQAISERNQLARISVVTMDQVLTIPSLP